MKTNQYNELREQLLSLHSEISQLKNELTKFIIDAKELKIEKKIKMPIRTGNRKYPFNEMQPGDSILLSDIYSTELMNRYRSALRNYVRYSKNGHIFETRKTSEGIRVWRTN